MGGGGGGGFDGVGGGVKKMAKNHEKFNFMSSAVVFLTFFLENVF